MRYLLVSLALLLPNIAWSGGAKTPGYLPVKHLKTALRATYAIAQGKQAMQRFCREHRLKTRHWVDFHGEVDLTPVELTRSIARYALSSVRKGNTVTARQQRRLLEAVEVLATDNGIDKTARTYLRDQGVEGWYQGYDHAARAARHVLPAFNPQRTAYLSRAGLTQLIAGLEQASSGKLTERSMQIEAPTARFGRKYVPAYRVDALTLLGNVLGSLPQRRIDQLVGAQSVRFDSALLAEE